MDGGIVFDVSFNASFLTAVLSIILDRHDCDVGG